MIVGKLNVNVMKKINNTELIIGILSGVILFIIFYGDGLILKDTQIPQQYLIGTTTNLYPPNITN